MPFIGILFFCARTAPGYFSDKSISRMRYHPLQVEGRPLCRPFGGRGCALLCSAVWTTHNCALRNNLSSLHRILLQSVTAPARETLSRIVNTIEQPSVALLSWSCKICLNSLLSLSTKDPYWSVIRKSGIFGGFKAAQNVELKQLFLIKL